VDRNDVRARPSVCPVHNSETNDPKVFALGTANDKLLGCPTSAMILELKGQC